jgi:predicted transcriptional regulator
MSFNAEELIEDLNTAQAALQARRSVVMQSIGEWARKKRQDAGVSLRRQAEEMSLSPAYISDLERGNRPWAIASVRFYEQGLKKATTSAKSKAK